MNITCLPRHGILSGEAIRKEVSHGTLVPDLIINHENDQFNKVRFSITDINKYQQTTGNKGKLAIKLQ